MCESVYLYTYLIVPIHHLSQSYSNLHPFHLEVANPAGKKMMLMMMQATEIFDGIVDGTSTDGTNRQSERKKQRNNNISIDTNI